MSYILFQLQVQAALTAGVWNRSPRSLRFEGDWRWICTSWLYIELSTTWFQLVSSSFWSCYLKRVRAVIVQLLLEELTFYQVILKYSEEHTHITSWSIGAQIFNPKFSKPTVGDPQK